jgi:predicted RNA binding protein YcfA (HicA-like mRNA interferase family)
MNRQTFIKILEDNGVYFHHHGKRHDIFIHEKTGKKIPIPRHKETPCAKRNSPKLGCLINSMLRQAFNF